MGAKERGNVDLTFLKFFVKASEKWDGSCWGV